MSTHAVLGRQPWVGQLRHYFRHARHTRRAIAARRVHGIQLHHSYR